MSNTGKAIWCFLSAVMLATVSPVWAITQSELNERISEEKAKWFAQIYQEVTKSKMAGRQSLSLKQINDYVVAKLEDSVAFSRLLDEAVANSVCANHANAAEEECNKNYRAFIYGNRNANEDAEKKTNEIVLAIFQNKDRAKVKSRFRTLIQVNIQEEFTSIFPDNFDGLLKIELPSLGLNLVESLLPKKPEVLSKLEMQEADPSYVSLAQKQISIRRSYLDPDNTSKAANISFTRYGKDDETRSDNSDRSFFDFNGAITWRPMATYRALTGQGSPKPQNLDLIGQRLLMEYAVGVEAQVNTDDDTSSVTHFLVGELNFSSKKNPAAFLSDNRFLLSLNYKTDRKYKAEIYEAVVDWAPSWYSVGMGRDFFHRPEFLHTDLNQDLDLLWRPFFGLTYLNIEDAGIFPNTSESDQLNFQARLAGAIKIFEKFSIKPEVKYTQEFKGDRDPHYLVSIAADFDLDDEGILSLSATFDHGEEAPTFRKSERFTIGLGVKF